MTSKVEPTDQEDRVMMEGIRSRTIRGMIRPQTEKTMTNVRAVWIKDMMVRMEVIIQD